MVSAAGGGRVGVLRVSGHEGVCAWRARWVLVMAVVVGAVVLVAQRPERVGGMAKGFVDSDDDSHFLIACFHACCKGQ